MASLLGAGALAILAPLAVSWYSSSRTASDAEWDASEFVIRKEKQSGNEPNYPLGEKSPVLLNQQQQQQQQQQPSAAVQMTREQKKHAIVAAAMHNVTGTGYGSASVLLNTVKDSDAKKSSELTFTGEGSGADNFGDTTKFFEAIDQDEFKKKLEEKKWLH